MKCCFIDEMTQFYSCGFSLGFGLYNAETGEKLSFTKTPYKNIDNISNLADSNLIALSREGKNDVQVWDRCKNSHFLSFCIDPKENIKAIKIRPDVIFIITLGTVYAYSLYNQNKILFFPTNKNTSAFDISPSYSSYLMAVPLENVGSFAFYNYLEAEYPISIVQAFKKPLKNLKFSRDGRFLAASSHDGNKIKIYKVPTGELQATLNLSVTELRTHKIGYIAFNEYGNQLFAQTETNNIYLFDLPVFDILSETESQTNIKPSCTFSPSKKQFWTCFGSELYKMIVITSNNKIIYLNYNKKAKCLEKEKEIHFDV
ncbi:hypothetical protein TRFO_17846 [Tritrichomonas foetus]|uniref:Anaphase-promoting complex subunit 4 WD40 domain-containing protein n=1 Tax=Tritrichomonas foetus TaxID=1144522 RepID=A0A1J4KRC6_9EUKA|nr:hypothetical protein TRFO_17846 [Tritrichomonas foetus]|eukprot:OHT12364.1 hypothetical protein TRFO_17846 [Tritrichomonas foetus]